MRLRISMTAANERLMALVTEGYNAISTMEADYENRKKTEMYNDKKDLAELVSPVNAWIDTVAKSLLEIFPTSLEKNVFLDPGRTFPVVFVKDNNYKQALEKSRHFVRNLDKILQEKLPRYTDMPSKTRLFVQDIDSFNKVRDINHAAVNDTMINGRLDRSENFIQTALEDILDVKVHKEDWSGEKNDLYTSNVIVNGACRATAFLLKGNGLKVKTMEIKHCGANGDQIVRLFESPADLFVIQYVGPISESVIKDAEGKAQQLRSQGKEVHYCIMDGQDTAMVLRAYGKL